MLWAACHPEPDFDACATARDEGANLAWAARLAVGQRISGLVWRVVESWSHGDGWAGPLRADAKRCAAQARLVLPRIGQELLGPLAAAGLQPLVWKGATLAERYPGKGLRPMDDVDILLPPDCITDAIQLLRRNHWRVAKQRGHHHYEVAMVHPALPGLPVELHQALATAADRAFRLSAAELWESRVPATVAGEPVYGLSPEHELIALVTHAAKPFHTFERLIWTVDLAVVLRSAAQAGNPVDWTVVEDAADRARARTALAVALIQLARLGTEAPASLLDLHCSGTRRDALTPLLSEDWPVQARDEPTRYRLGYALTDDPRLVARRAASEVLDGGPARAPLGAATLVWRATRRWLEFQRTAHQAN